MSEQTKRWLGEIRTRAGLGDVSPQVLIVASVVLVLAVAWSLWRWWPVTDHADQFSGSVSGADAPAEVPTASGSGQVLAAADTSVVVHVAGQVRNPGVYHLAPGSRAIDAVTAAGGAIGDAAMDTLNLARALTDGEQLYVPTEEEVAAGISVAPVQSQTSSNSGSSGALININTADAAALETLPGVGPVTAQKIVAEREANGPFSGPDDLSRVSGIGPKRLEQLRDVVSVN